jgi:hypothetical protein
VVESVTMLSTSVVDPGRESALGTGDGRFSSASHPVSSSEPVRRRGLPASDEEPPNSGSPVAWSCGRFGWSWAEAVRVELGRGAVRPCPLRCHRTIPRVPGEVLADEDLPSG